MENLKEEYDYVCNKIKELDKEIANLQGKREAYSDIRIDLYNLLKDKENVESQS